MVKHCPNCGKENKGWKFCPDCGAELKEKKEPCTLEEALTIWANNPENKRRYSEVRQYYEDLLTRPVMPSYDSADIKDNLSNTERAESSNKKDDLSIFYYDTHSDGTITITGLKDKNVTQIVIPYNAVAIADYAFATCEKLKSVVIGSKVKSIGESAFFNCGITSIHIPQGVTSIPKNAFCKCESLISVYLPNGITSIGASAFSSCDKLTTINIPESVTSIGETAFCFCDSLCTIRIPGNASYIGRDIFVGCGKIKSVYITRGDVVGRSWSNLLSDDSIIEKLNLPYDCEIFKT